VKNSPTPCEQFYGLRSRAFSLTPDLRFVYHSQSHTRAVEEVTAGLRRREGLIVVTGEVGTGKTMLCRTLLETFEARTFQSVILDPLLTVEDLLYQVLTDFGLISEARGRRKEPFTEVTRHHLVDTLQKFLTSLIPLDAHAVIMIDEAQHLGPQVLEEIRLLSNFETDEAKLLQIVLVGQPNLDALLRRPDMRQLNQRVARRCELQPLTPGEVRDYVERRLLVASSPAPGETDAPPAADAEDVLSNDLLHINTYAQFMPAALEAIAAISHGIPRVVNTLCDRALEAGFERKANPIDIDAVIAGAEHLKLPVPELTPARTRSWKPAAAAVAVAAVLLVIWGWTREASSPSAATATSSTGQSAPATPPSPAPNAGAPAASVPAANVAIEQPRSGPAPGPAAAPAPGVVAPATASPSTAAATSPRTATPAPPESYQVVVAAFRTEQRATTVADGIRTSGLPVTTRLDSTGTWYSIVVGPYRTSAEAQTAQASLTRQGFADTRVTFNGPDVR
jgi:general secretion pathway protein A